MHERLGVAVVRGGRQFLSGHIVMITVGAAGGTSHTPSISSTARLRMGQADRSLGADGYKIRRALRAPDRASGPPMARTGAARWFVNCRRSAARRPISCDRDHMARKPANFQWIGYSDKQVELLDLLDHVGNNAWARNSPTESLTPI